MLNGHGAPAMHLSKGLCRQSRAMRHDTDLRLACSFCTLRDLMRRNDSWPDHVDVRDVLDSLSSMPREMLK